MRWVGVQAAVLLVCATGCGSVGTMEKAAAKDPMKCERDPNCARGRSSYQDCYRQCVDDPQCVERCQSVQQQIDSPPGNHLVLFWGCIAASRAMPGAPKPPPERGRFGWRGRLG
jgi:hypothetical protein